MVYTVGVDKKVAELMGYAGDCLPLFPAMRNPLPPQAAQNLKLQAG
jgi:hypothetical protein